MNEKEFDSIGHALGINVYHSKHSQRHKDKFLPDEFYRCHYCYSCSSVNASLPEEFHQIKKDGLIEVSSAVGTSYWFVTEKGKLEFRNKFAEEITSKYIPCKGKETYQKYLDNEGYFNFSDFLGIQMPKSNHNGYKWMFESEKYSGVCGGWFKTKKEAKASYRDALRNYKNQLKAIKI